MFHGVVQSCERTFAAEHHQHIEDSRAHSQPGERNAHRLEQLGVGVRVSRARHTPQLLRRLADALIASPQVRERLAALQAQARRLDGRRCGADAVEAFIARHAGLPAAQRMVPST